MSPPQITLHGLATTSLLVSLLIAVFLPLRPLLRRVIGSQWLCVLWVAVLARLLVPVPLESRWSVFNRWQGSAAPTPAVVQEPVKIKVSVVNDASSKPSPGVMDAPATHASAPSRPALSAGDVFNTLWLAGFTTSLCILALRWNQTRRLAARTRAVADERLSHIFSSIPQKWRRNVELRTTDAIQVPTLAGILRPQIWMPREWPGQFTDGELRNVLLHELGHARRGDLIVQWLFAIAQSVHWFNPLVWMAGRTARLDREMACDAWVLARDGADGDGYGAALVKAVQLLCEPLQTGPAAVAMASGRVSLRARISGIGAFRPIPAWRGVAGIVAMLAALAAMTTSCKKATDAAGDDKSTATQPNAPQSSAPVAGGGSKNIELSGKFVMITEDAWKKLCAEKPEFKEFAGKFPELDREKMSGADLAKGLNNIQDGAWIAPEAGEVKLLGPLSDEEKQKIIDILSNTKGATILSTPSASFRTGQTAEIPVSSMEFRYPTAFKPSPQTPGGVVPTEFTTKNAGLTMEVKSSMNENGTVDVQFTPTMTGFMGFLQEKDGARTFVKHPMTRLSPSPETSRPVFSISTGRADMNIPPSRSVLLGGVTLDNQSTDSDAPTDNALGKMTGLNGFSDDSEPNPETVRHVLLVFATADIVAPPAPAMSPASAEQLSPTPQPFTEGKVIAVNPGWNPPFAVINIGARQGMVPNAEGLVKRDDRVIARLKINTIEPGMTVADIIPGSVAQGEQVKPGDKVIFTGLRATQTPEDAAQSAPAATSTAPSATPAPAAQPSPNAHPDTKAGAAPSGTQIKIESKLIQISEETWKQLCPENPHPTPTPGAIIVGGRNGDVAFDFKDLSSAFPQLRSEKQSYAELVREWTGKQSTPKKAAPPNTTLLAVLSGEQYERMMKILNNTGGSKVLASPTIITKSAGKCVILGRTGTLRYPSAYGPDKTSPSGVSATEFTTKDIGYTVQLLPVLEKDNETIDVHIDSEFTALLGFLGPDNATFAPPNWEPIDGHKIVTPAITDEKMKTDVSVWDGQTVLLGMVQFEVGADENGNPCTTRNIMLVTLTLHIVDADKTGPASPAPAGASPVPAANPELP